MYLAGEDPGASLGEEAGYQRLACPVAALSQSVFRRFDPLDSVRTLAATHEVPAKGIPVGCQSWVWRVSLGRPLLRSPLGRSREQQRRSIVRERRIGRRHVRVRCPPPLVASSGADAAIREVHFANLRPGLKGPRNPDLE